MVACYRSPYSVLHEKLIFSIHFLHALWPLEEFRPVLGRYPKFMIFIEFSFHKVIYKRVWFSPKKILKCWTGVSTFLKKLDRISQCWFSEIWEQLIILCRFSQTRYYFIFKINNQIFLIKIKIKYLLIWFLFWW